MATYGVVEVRTLTVTLEGHNMNTETSTNTRKETMSYARSRNRKFRKNVTDLYKREVMQCVNGHSNKSIIGEEMQPCVFSTSLDGYWAANPSCSRSHTDECFICGAVPDVFLGSRAVNGQEWVVAICNSCYIPKNLTIDSVRKSVLGEVNSILDEQARWGITHDDMGVRA